MIEDNNSLDKMEWKTLPPDPEMNFKVKIVHSTPLSFRPAPTTSPNMSPIIDFEAEMLLLAVRLANLKII